MAMHLIIPLLIGEGLIEGPEAVSAVGEIAIDTQEVTYSSPVRPIHEKTWRPALFGDVTGFCRK